MLTLRAKAYRVHRRSYSPPGYHDRRRSSVERHLERAPRPIPAKKGKQYPKVYKNSEKHYNTGSTLHEYPTLDFPWDTQNHQGQGRRTNPDDSITFVSPGYVRTITDSDKIIQGVSYHPSGDKQRYVRAEEIRRSRGRSSKRRRRHS